MSGRANHQLASNQPRTSRSDGVRSHRDRPGPVRPRDGWSAARDGLGPQTFAAWLEGGPCVSGRSLVLPWARLRDGHGEDLPDGRALAVRQAGLWHFALSVGGEERWAIRPSLPNTVLVQRLVDGRVLMRSGAIRPSIDLATEELSPDEWLVVLFVLGSGLIRRARRGGTISQANLPRWVG